jgi:hypothetical protein
VAVKLKESDWEVLFPAEDFKIGSTTLELTPLSLSGLATITRRLTNVVDKVTALELNLDSLTSEVGKIVQLVSLILGDAPEILAEMSGLDLEDIQRLPLDIAVGLFSACLDVNLRSQESLVKNFKGLGGKVAKFMSGNQTVQ